MVPDFAGGKPSPLWNAAKKPCPELQSGPCCVPRRCLFPARKGSCRKTGGFTPIFWRTNMRKSCFYREWCFQWKMLDGNDLSSGTWCFHRFSIFETGWKWAPFRACIQQKTPNSTGPLMRIDPRPEQPHFFMFSISTHFHPEDAIAWEWSGWKQHPDDDNDRHSPL